MLFHLVSRAFRVRTAECLNFWITSGGKAPEAARVHKDQEDDVPVPHSLIAMSFLKKLTFSCMKVENTLTSASNLGFLLFGQHIGTFRCFRVNWPELAASARRLEAAHRQHSGRRPAAATGRHGVRCSRINLSSCSLSVFGVTFI